MLGAPGFRKEARIFFCALPPDGLTVACSGSEGGTLLSELSGATKLQRWSSSNYVHALAFSPDGKMLAAKRRGFACRQDNCKSTARCRDQQTVASPANRSSRDRTDRGAPLSDY